MRCIAHILNLVVNNGLKEASNSVKKKVDQQKQKLSPKINSWTTVMSKLEGKAKNHRRSLSILPKQQKVRLRGKKKMCTWNKRERKQQNLTHKQFKDNSNAKKWNMIV